MNFYRFPQLHLFDDVDVEVCMDKIIEEAKEAKDAKGTERIIEIMDVMQSCETALRNMGIPEYRLLYFMNVHNKKDRIRGYDVSNEKQQEASDFSNLLYRRVVRTDGHEGNWFDYEPVEERTCKNIPQIDGAWFKCDKCCFYIDWYAGDVKNDESLNYCPNCGAKVVSE